MKFNRRNHRLGAAAIGLTVLGAAAATLGANPVAAAGIITAVTTVTCSAAAGTFPSWCISGTNTSSGVGVVGTSNTGTGVLATSTSGTAVVATTTSSDYTILGQNKSPGGLAPFEAVGVEGKGNNYGVRGDATSRVGTAGFSASGPGVFGDSGSGSGGWFTSSSGYGGLFDSDSNYGVFARSQNNVAFVGRTANGNASDIQGSHIGLLGRAPTTGYPLVLTDATPHTLFYVDGHGNVFYAGSLYNFVLTVDGGKARSFTASATQPTIEDTGTAQLVNGIAVVRLEPTFAASIDPTTPYRVFVTPAGDTRGLFVANRTPAGFVVREAQAGRSTVGFDYRVVATALGKTGQRMARIDPATDTLVKAPLPVLPAAAVTPPAWRAPVTP